MFAEVHPSCLRRVAAVVVLLPPIVLECVSLKVQVLVAVGLGWGWGADQALLLAGEIAGRRHRRLVVQGEQEQAVSMRALGQLC